MNKQIKIILIFIITAVLFSCDFFNPGDYKTAVEAYNEVDNPLYGNHWKRIYYAGEIDISDRSGSCYTDAVLDNKFYRLAWDWNNDGTLQTDQCLYQVDLSSKISKQLSIPDASSAGDGIYWISGSEFETVNGNLFLFCTETNSDESSEIYIFRFDTDNETWVAVADSDPVGDAEYYSGYSETFGIGSNTYICLDYTQSSTGDHRKAVLKYDSSTDHFSVTATEESHYDAYYTDTDLVLFNTSFDIFNRYNFTTDSFSSLVVTDLRDLTVYNSDSGYDEGLFFLTDELVLCCIRYDKTEAADGSFSPPVLEYVDLAGDLTIRQQVFSDYTSIGPFLSSKLYHDCIYLTTYNYTDDESNENCFSTNKSIYLINITDGSMQTFSSIPGSEFSNYRMAWIETCGLDMLLCSTSRDEIWWASFPYNYYLNPNTNSWVEVAHSFSFVVGWSNSISNPVYNGKYYTDGHSGPFTLEKCIIEYTPPVY